MRTWGLACRIGVLVLVLLAGCAGTMPGQSPTPTPARTPPTPGGGDSPHDFPGGDPTNQTRFANLSVGNESDLPEGDAHHEYRVWNNAPADRRIEITVWRDQTVIRNESVRFPAGGVLMLTIYDPGAYRVVVAPADDRRLVTAPQAFDCNHRSWEIAVHPDGTIDSRVLQTLIACRTETG